MTKKLIVSLVVILVVVGAGLYYDKIPNLFGASSSHSKITMLGSSSNLESLPAIYVFANSTTTDAGGSLEDGGNVINQIAFLEGVEKVRLNISGIGNYATNTISIRIRGSHDNTNYYDIMYASSSPINPIGNNTTTPSVLPYVTSFEPGVATTTWSYDYNVEGFKSIRFLLKGPDDIDADLAEGVQAWIDMIILDPVSR